MRNIIFKTFIIVFLVFIYSSYISAQTADDLKVQINNTNDQIEKLNNEIKVLSSQIAITSEEKNTLANAIKDLTLKKNKLIKEREKTEKKISATGLIIQTISNEIDNKKETIDKSKESIATLIKSLYQNDDATILQNILSQDNLSDISREYNDIVGLNKEIGENIDIISTEKDNLSKSKNKKEEEKKALTVLKKDLITKELEISQNKKEKDSLLAETKNKESNYKKLLLEQQKRKEAFEKSLEDYEAQLQFILNPKILPKEGSGVLSWPLENIIVTSPFGSRWGKFHYGMDFRAKVGTSVKAMAMGTVEGTGDTDIACKGASFGKWVFIRYNNGLSSTYGHLSSISATVGQKVNAGDIVALSGNTGSSTGPHLHVAVYASTGVNVDTVPSKSCGGKVFTQPIAALNAYLNPSLYLPKMLANMIKK